MLEVDAVSNNSQCSTPHVGGESSRVPLEVRQRQPRGRVIGVVAEAEFAEQALAGISGV
jgi:hypothetical protein